MLFSLFCASISAKLNYVGVAFPEDSDVPSEVVTKAFKKAVMTAGLIYRARCKVRWETAAEKLKRKRLRRHFLKRLEKANEKFLRSYEEKFEIEYEGIP